MSQSSVVSHQTEAAAVALKENGTKAPPKLGAIVAEGASGSAESSPCSTTDLFGRRSIVVPIRC